MLNFYGILVPLVHSYMLHLVTQISPDYHRLCLVVKCGSKMPRPKEHLPSWSDPVLDVSWKAGIITRTQFTMADTAVGPFLQGNTGRNTRGLLRVIILCTITAAAVASRLFSVISTYRLMRKPVATGDSNRYHRVSCFSSNGVLTVVYRRVWKYYSRMLV